MRSDDNPKVLLAEVATITLSCHCGPRCNTEVKRSSGRIKSAQISSEITVTPCCWHSVSNCVSSCWFQQRPVGLCGLHNTSNGGFSRCNSSANWVKSK
ncbi:hypothetical protein D3C75_1112490 [compost metagenome]